MLTVCSVSSNSQSLELPTGFQEKLITVHRDVPPTLALSLSLCTAFPSSTRRNRSPSLLHSLTLSLPFSQDPGGGSTSGKGHSCMWLSYRKHGVVPVCLEGLGLPRAGSLLPVLRGTGPLGDQHEEKKVAVVLRQRSTESQFCMRAEPKGIHTDRLTVFRAGGGQMLTSGQRVRGRGSAIRAEP